MIIIQIIAGVVLFAFIVVLAVGSVWLNIEKHEERRKENDRRRK